jgi:hypothetical protein
LKKTSIIYHGSIVWFLGRSSSEGLKRLRWLKGLKGLKELLTDPSLRSG